MAQIQLQPIDRLRVRSRDFLSKIDKYSASRAPGPIGDQAHVRIIRVLAELAEEAGDNVTEVIRHASVPAGVVGDILDNRAVPFVIKDAALVDEAINSKIKGVIPAEELVLPFEAVLVQVPRRKTPNDEWWDVVYISRSRGLHAITGMVSNVFVVAFMDTRSPRTSDILPMVGGGHFPLDGAMGISDAGFVSTRECTGTVPDAAEMMVAIKLAFFLNAMKQDIEYVKRKKAPKKAPKAVRQAYREYREIKIRLSEVQKRYEDEHPPKEGGGPGVARHRVRGHYKMFRKGRIAELNGGVRVLWCPSHMRGRIGGGVPDPKYVIT